MPQFAYVIFVDGEFDQVCCSKECACREKKDLMDMGCTVQVRKCPWGDQDKVIEEMTQ